jgi:hypothetical protein
MTKVVKDKGGTLKKIFSISLISILALALSGCTPALKADDVSVNLNLGEWQYSLVGDEAIIEGSVEVKSENDSKYNLVLQTKDNTDKWVDLSDQPELSGSLSTKFSLKLEKEADQTLRLALNGSDGSLITTSDEVTLTTKDLKLGIRDLYYNESQACESSEAKCLDATIASNYPGLTVMSAKQKKSVLSRYSVSRSGTPDLNSILPDTNWLMPSDKCTTKYTKLDFSKPLPGRTYTVDVGGYTVHVTYLEGKFYYYATFC